MKTNVKKKIVSCRDPKTGHWGRQEVEQTTYRYDDQEKISIVNEFLHENRDAQAIVDKYHISSVMTLYSWVGRVMIQTETLSLQEQTEDDMARKSKDDQIRELKAQLKQARKEAELERLRAHAYDTMINLAEETFNIPIRKKSGTKQ